MPIQCVRINDIRIDKSRFACKGILSGDDDLEPHIERSLQDFGVLTPVLVYRDNCGEYHLIDGFKRIRFARQSGLTAVEAVVMPESTPAEEIVAIIFYNKLSRIKKSAISKIRFVLFALDLGASEERVLKFICPPLELKPHRSFIEECRRIHGLPAELKEFCHEKRFSLKQILNLAYYPHDLLVHIMAWKPLLHLSASVLDEVASNLKDYLRANNKTVSDFAKDDEVEGIINSGLNPRERTERLRRLIHERRYPTLTGVNAKIQKMVDELNLPEEINISWDRTLENRRADLSIHPESAKEWNDLMNILNAAETARAIGNILNEL